jgi:hypothetical protein
MPYRPRRPPYVDDGTFSPPGCFRSDEHQRGRSVRCPGKVVWRGLTVNRRGRRIYVEACEFHGGNLSQRRPRPAGGWGAFD